MFPPELYAAVKRIEASAAPLLRSSAERIVILDTHVVLECTLWRDESESDSPLGCALKAGRIVPAASHETLFELAGVAARPVKQMLEAEAAARALTMLERWGKLIRMPSKDMLTEAAQALDSEKCALPRPRGSEVSHPHESRSQYLRRRQHGAHHWGQTAAKSS